MPNVMQLTASATSSAQAEPMSLHTLANPVGSRITPTRKLRPHKASFILLAAYVAHSWLFLCPPNMWAVPDLYGIDALVFTV